MTSLCEEFEESLVTMQRESYYASPAGFYSVSDSFWFDIRAVTDEMGNLVTGVVEQR